jgi:serine phosphatase RsbU (regulator of sigma subunit)
VHSTLCQIKYNKGSVPIRNFSYKEYKGQPQNKDICQDLENNIYIANENHVLQYDGENWVKIEIAGGAKVRSLFIDKSNRIYVGAKGDFGFLEPQINGEIIYKSISSSLNLEKSIWSISQIDETIIFQSYYNLFLFDSVGVKKIDLPGKCRHSFTIDNNYFVFSYQDGLMRFNLNEMSFSQEDKYIELINNRIQSIVKVADDERLIVAEHGGVFKSDISGIFNINSNIINFYKTNELSSGMLLSDNNYAIASQLEGLVIMDENGDLRSYFNTSVGLQNNEIKKMFQDHEDGLWIAMNRGVSRISINEPISVFDNSHGLEGIVQGVSTYENDLYSVTLQGIYKMEAKHKEINKSLDDLKPKFIKLTGQGLETQCWGLLEYNNRTKSSLLAISNNGIHEIESNGSNELILPCDAYYLFQSEFEPKRVFVLVNDGLKSMFYDGTEWKDEGNIKGVDKMTYSLLETEDAIYVGSCYDNFITKLDFHLERENLIIENVQVYDTSSGLPRGQLNRVTQFDNLLLAGTDQGIYELKNNQFEKNTALSNLLLDTNSYIHLLESHDDKLWSVAYGHESEKYEIGYFQKRKGKYEWFTKPFKSLEDELINAIYHDKDSITWLGGVHGLYRYDAKVKKNYDLPFNTSIRTVSIRDLKDSTIFYGAFSNKEGRLLKIQPEHFKYEIPYQYHNMTFTFASQDYESDNKKLYSYQLVGEDNDWSDWKRETKKEYTNLREGKYTFKVRGKSIYGVISEPAEYEFTILPPWYRTWWALSIFITAGVTGILGFNYLYNANLRRIIQLKTKEVVEQKELVEEQNKDIISSIDYAQKIQQAILPSEKRRVEDFNDLFVFFKPRDIVSGDFYWMLRDEEEAWICVADCTGHGVPGAFMSILGTAILNESVKNKKILLPSKILDATKKGIIESLGQSEKSSSKDGMDASICRLNYDNLQMDFAGANNPIYIIRESGEGLSVLSDTSIEMRQIAKEEYTLFEIKANKMPVGIFTGKDDPFTNHTIQLLKGDTVYLFTDGFPDQFGGHKGKKYKYKPFKEFLLSIVNHPIDQQSEMLNKEFRRWSAGYEQVDDVCIIGLRI